MLSVRYPTLGQTDPRAVRIDDNGQISLRPLIDFREPGREVPIAKTLYRRPPVVRVQPPVPVWLMHGGEV
jgi:hypothetical protein